jgi:hypothetical protein
MKQKKTFRLEEDVVSKLEAMSKQKHCSQTDILEGLVREYRLSENSPDAHDIDWQKLYFEEKQRADKTNERLLSVSEKVADSLQASQVLQAMDKPQLESGEVKKRQSWWKFWE